MNFNKLVHIRRGYMFSFTQPHITSIKLSPEESTSIIHEHQYNEKYVLSYETPSHIHFAILKNNSYLKCKWKIEKRTYELLFTLKPVLERDGKDIFQVNM
jgi:hypothetical protein